VRSVICHFFNEAYLLPWWLKHHRSLFDHGVMIDHGSTDASADIVRELAPHWRLVRSRLTQFSAYLTDLEVMGYEQELPGWKIALNVTEFLMPTVGLDFVQSELKRMGRMGCVASGVIIVDHQPDFIPTGKLSLPEQKHWGLDDNAELQPQLRLEMQFEQPMRNRFFHSSEVGMYLPGRHLSYHPDSRFRLVDLMIFYFGYAPWNQEMIHRRLQIKAKLDPLSVQRGLVSHHLLTTEELQRGYELVRSRATNLMEHPHAGQAIALATKRYTLG
jgi:hypothetical protein